MHQHSDHYWQTTMKETVYRAFPKALSSAEDDHPHFKAVVMRFEGIPLYLMHHSVYLPLISESLNFTFSSSSPSQPPNGLNLLFRRVARLLGLSVRTEMHTLFANDPRMWEVQKPFDILDIVTLRETVKPMHITAHAQGVITRMRVDTARKTRGSLYVTNLYASSLEHFRAALFSVPRDSRTLRNVADIWVQLQLNDLAEVFYRYAVRGEENSSCAFYDDTVTQYDTHHTLILNYSFYCCGGLIYSRFQRCQFLQIWSLSPQSTKKILKSRRILPTKYCFDSECEGILILQRITRRCKGFSNSQSLIKEHNQTHNHNHTLNDGDDGGGGMLHVVVVVVVIERLSFCFHLTAIG